MSQPSRVLLCAVYMRVSTEDQAKGYSLPEQQEQCLRKAAELAQEIEQSERVKVTLRTVEFEDHLSGDILDRPGLEKARDFVRQHKPTFFICLDPDRFARKLVNQLLVTQELEAAGTQLVFVQHDYQKNAEGQLFYSLRGAIAEYEKEKIRERTTRGTRGKKKKGLLAHCVSTYGYTFNSETDTLDINGDEARWVRQIFSWAAGQLPPSKVADKLNAMGIPSKKGTRWYSSTIRQMLKNMTYVGTMYTNRYDWGGMTSLMQIPKGRRTVSITAKIRPQEEWIPVPVPAIIDRAIFDAVQATFATLKRQAQRGVGLLSGLAVCGLCGGSINYITSPQNEGYVLRCHNKYPILQERKHPRPKCSLPHVKRTLIEEPVWREVVAAILNPEEVVRRIQAEGRNEDPVDPVAQLEQEAALLRDEITGKQKEQAVILGQLGKGRVELKVAEALLDELKRGIGALHQSLSMIEERLLSLTRAKAAARGIQLQSIQEGTGQMKAIYSETIGDLDLEERRHLLRQLVGSVAISPGRKYEIKWLFPAES